ncbi:MAG: N-acetylmuramoyl-L-alanine amidase [Lachnospira sp.]|nr:N-acetylmuramoyl-L-alanine amidase [Lachnospira sp.]
MAIKVALDAGHGGNDAGAQYKGRAEKDDVLELARAVGNILTQNGIDVFYTRENDEYETPFKKATDANNSAADFFISLHRNSSEYPNQYNGIQTLVYNDDGIRADLARNINKRLENIGFTNIGVEERKNLVVLRRTNMPAVLVEVGFINTDADNALFDNQFDEIANGIAQGILDTINSETSTISNTVMSTTEMQIVPTTTPEYIPSDNSEEFPEQLYRVQTGAYKNKENADRLLNSLLIEGFPAFMVQEDGYYKVQVGAFNYLANAIKMEQRLRRFRYNTFIVYN